MIEEKEKPIKGLKIKYNNVIYDKILHFSVSNWNKENTANFTHLDSQNVRISVYCNFKDIEIIKE